MVARASSRTTPIMRLKRSFKRHWILYLMLSVPVVYILTFAYAPMVGLLMAFEDYRPTRGILGSKWVGLKHFERFVSMPVFWTLLKNTLAISLYSLAAGFPIPIILALALNEVRSSKLKKTVQMYHMRRISYLRWSWLAYCRSFFPRSLGQSTLCGECWDWMR